MNLMNDDRNNGSSLSQYTKGHNIGIQDNAVISRQSAVIRTYKKSKSRQSEAIERPFGTERAVFNKSALMSGQSTRKTNITLEDD